MRPAPGRSTKGNSRTARRSASDAITQMASAIRSLAKCLTAPLAQAEVAKRWDSIMKLSGTMVKMLPTVDSWLEQQQPDEIGRFHHRVRVIQQGQKTWVVFIESKLRAIQAGSPLPWAYGPRVGRSSKSSLPRIDSPLVNDVRFRVSVEKIVTALRCWARDAKSEERAASRTTVTKRGRKVRRRGGRPVNKDNTQEPREEVARLWHQFSREYKKLGYKRASWQSFTDWAAEEHVLLSDDWKKLKSMYDAYRKTPRPKRLN
jgi:hypothetical protein